MRKVLTFFFLSITAVAAIYFLGMQIAYIYVEHLLEWAVENNSLFWPTLDISYLFFDENHFYICLLNVFAVTAAVEIFFNTVFSKHERELRKNKRMLTPEEKKNHTHLASKHEAKKGMQRIQFDRFGHLRDKTPIQSVEILMRMFYVRWCLMIMKNKYTRQFEMNSRLETDDNQVLPKENQSKDTTSGKREKKINIPFISVWMFIAVCLVAVLIRFNDVQAITAPLILVKDCIVSLLMTLWNEIYHIHSLIHFLDNPYAVWILSVILWCAGIVLLFKLIVLGAAILLALIRDHAMVCLHKVHKVRN